MRELGGRGRHVLPEERDGELVARSRHIRLELERALVLLHREQPEAHAIDLLEAVRQESAQPLAHDVEQLECLGIDARRDGAIGRGRRLARQLVQRVHGVGGRVALLALLRLGGLHRLRVDARLEQRPVGHDVFHLLLAAHARHMLALEPQLHPLRHDRLEQLMVPLDVEQH